MVVSFRPPVPRPQEILISCLIASQPQQRPYNLSTHLRNDCFMGSSKVAMFPLVSSLLTACPMRVRGFPVVFAGWNGLQIDFRSVSKQGRFLGCHYPYSS